MWEEAIGVNAIRAALIEVVFPTLVSVTSPCIGNEEEEEDDDDDDVFVIIKSIISPLNAGAPDEDRVPEEMVDNDDKVGLFIVRTLPKLLTKNGWELELELTLLTAGKTDVLISITSSRFSNLYRINLAISMPKPSCVTLSKFTVHMSSLTEITAV